MLCLLLVACEPDIEPDEQIHKSPKPQDNLQDVPKNVSSQNVEGDCANYDLARYVQNGKLHLSRRLKVLRDKTKVYASANARLASNQKLAFNTVLKHKHDIDLESGRIKVAKYGRRESLGWVSLKDLLCVHKPLVDPDKGLEKKFFIKTENKQRGKSSVFVNAYPAPREQCDGKCTKLSRFTMYFIVDQEDDWFLLASDYYIKQPLVGWVRKSDGYPWDTAYGLRPRDDLKYKDAKGEGAGTICVHQNLKSAINGDIKHCNILLQGGKTWYKISKRVPVLDIVDKNGVHIQANQKGNEKAFYKVALAIPGIGMKKDMKITAKQLGQRPLYEKIAENMKFIDVLFLIDGTASMQSVIDMVKGDKNKPGLVQTIADTLRNDPDFKSSKFRFGFRIYRDKYAGAGNLGDGMPLKAEYCEKLPEFYLKRNRQQFNKEIAKIEVTDEKGKGDDYPENLFGGIKKILDTDSRSCGKHTKLLFVIGDNGNKKVAEDSALSMKNLKSIIRQLKNKERWFTFFIQTPNKAHTATSPISYNQAYELYHNQAYTFLQEVLKGSKAKDSLPEKFFIRLQNDETIKNGELVKYIVKQIKKISQYSIIEDLRIDLRGGAALTEAIARLQKKHTEVPGLFWEFIEDESCKSLGEQCTKRTYDTSFSGYIPVSKDISLDVWMTSNQLDKLIKDILSTFSEGFNGQDPSLQREGILKTIAENLHERLKEPEISASTNYADYIQRKLGLPVRTQSPLFSYTSAQIYDENQVPDCEIERLAIWAKKSGEILSKLLPDGTHSPDFFAEKPSENDCPRASENGKRIPFIDGDIGSKFLGKGYSYKQTDEALKTERFWVPEEYLP
jgi:hypothetical protein